MDDWDADDFDPTAQLQDKIATLGLEEKLRDEPEPEPKKEKSNKAASSKAKPAASGGQRELSRAEILDLQKRSDMELFADLIGAESTDKKFTELESRLDFTEFAEKTASAFSARSGSAYYTDFVTVLVDQITNPLNKFQLENIVTLLQGKVKQLAEAEKAEKEKEEAEKAAREAQSKQKNKKKIKKEVFDDYVEDDYDDYIDKF
uniref:Eukaryotic translation initiation factor 3 30 kDa subunit n=2 Tax=Bursaphelenchus xylophilus TaxID=6326 RepID=A0A1I7S628_BURXY